jgi:heme/copper-type cytochrome/quinol oxidase subunit 2|tara:strand:+ start:125 stop:277 length:153 start_codon:yes stop_codon:yes gene_type:complete
LTFAEGITLGILGTTLTVIGWFFAMWIYSRKQEREKEKEAQEKKQAKLFG